MLAEIYNKISQTGNNLSNRLEDKLTGDFFGAIRYLPFELGLKHILTTADFSEADVRENWLNYIEKEKGYATEIHFWHREEEGEIDLLLTNDKLIIGIEVKYLSGLSSDDSEDVTPLDYTESINQLSRYSRMIKNISKDQDLYLLFLAPYEMMNEVRKKTLEISPEVKLGFMCWEDIHKSLQSLSIAQFDTGHQLIINDLKALLSKKGLIRFNGFHSNILNQPITRSAYFFEYEDSTNKDTWIWPTKSIKEEQVYVYKPTE